jgi:hypothetical protein
VEDGKKIIRKGPFLLRQEDNLFVPALWKKKEIIAYSRTGYQNQSWLLPDDWRGTDRVDVYAIGLEGCLPVGKNVAVANATLALSLEPDQAVTIVPAGTPMGVEEKK